MLNGLRRYWVTLLGVGVALALYTPVAAQAGCWPATLCSVVAAGAAWGGAYARGVRRVGWLSSWLVCQLWLAAMALALQQHAGAALPQRYGLRLAALWTALNVAQTVLGLFWLASLTPALPAGRRARGGATLAVVAVVAALLLCLAWPRDVAPPRRAMQLAALRWLPPNALSAALAHLAQAGIVAAKTAWVGEALRQGAPLSVLQAHCRWPAQQTALLPATLQAMQQSGARSCTALAMWPEAGAAWLAQQAALPAPWHTALQRLQGDLWFSAGHLPAAIAAYQGLHDAATLTLGIHQLQQRQQWRALLPLQRQLQASLAKQAPLYTYNQTFALQDKRALAVLNVKVTPQAWLQRWAPSLQRDVWLPAAPQASHSRLSLPPPPACERAPCQLRLLVQVRQQLRVEAEMPGSTKLLATYVAPAASSRDAGNDVAAWQLLDNRLPAAPLLALHLEGDFVLAGLGVYEADDHAM